MDDSISLVFSGSAPDELLNESFAIKDQVSYETILATTKESFSDYKNEIKRSTFPTYFVTLLQNCRACIPYSLENAATLQHTELPENKVIEYLNDVISLLQMLTKLYKSLVDVSLSCCSVEAFPTITGEIIFSVFVHCRDSESLYGHNLKSVENHLKDLFRICHNLQLTYLVILEKHFIFDLTQEKDKSVLIEAVKINLEIGEVVQSLDVKTMAEQWKAYTLICEKFSKELCDFDIVFQESSLVLCKLIKDNLASVEKFQDDKIVVRSLKVTSFTIKILLKICTIFRQMPNKNYSAIVELLQCINLTINSAENLEKSLASLMNSHVVIPSDCLIKELLSDEQFVNCLVNSPSSAAEDHLGLFLVIASVMKCISQANIYPRLKIRLIDCVYSLLPEYAFMIFRERITTESGVHRSLFTQLLVSTTAMALTMTNEEFSALEKRMIGSILDTECLNALFSTHLWAVLARHITPQLLFNQLIWLCTMYKKLALHGRFYGSPQYIHFTHVLSLLFKVMGEEDQVKICKQFRVHDDDNMALWAAIQIKNLPTESQGKAEEAIAEKLKNVFKKLRESDSADVLINTINLAATCTYKNSRIDDYLVKLWLKACQENQPIVLGLENSTMWFYGYIKALVALTESMVDRLKERSDNFVKVLHVVHGLIRTGDSEMKLILTGILCKLASCELNENKNLTDSHITEAFISLLQDSDDIVRNNLFLTLRRYRQNSYLDGVISNIVRENDTLQDVWENQNGRTVFESPTISKYNHKCRIAKNVRSCPFQEFEDSVLNKKSFSEQESKITFEKDAIDDFHFDSGGSEIIETEEPSSKRGKSNIHEADNIVRSLEDNVTLLARQTEFTAEQLVRIRNVCENLKNISH